MEAFCHFYQDCPMLPIIRIFRHFQNFQILVYSVKPSLTGLTPGPVFVEFIHLIPNLLTYPHGPSYARPAPPSFLALEQFIKN